jgi:hypothetical protein
MKITRRQLKRIIRESLNETLPPHLQKHFRADGSSVKDPEWEDVTPTGYGPGGDLEDRLNAVWDVVRADTLDALGGQATWEEIADEVLAAGYSIDPGLVDGINLLPFADQQKLFKKAFGTGNKY